MLPISNIRSPPTEPALSAPLLSPAIKEFPVAPVGTGCTPGSSSCQDCVPGDSTGPQDPRCHQLVPAIKPIAPDCSSCLESLLESPGSGDCQEVTRCEEARPASQTDCPAGDCGPDQGNKDNPGQNKGEKCSSEVCPPGPVRPSHDEEDDQRNSSSCRPNTGDPLCLPPGDDGDPQPDTKKGRADCPAGSDDPGCQPGQSLCEAGSEDPGCATGEAPGGVLFVIIYLN